MVIDLESSWHKVLHEEFEKDYMIGLQQFLKAESDAGYQIYPQSSAVFNAFNSSPFNQVKVVILGQDPYPGEHQAHGLSFSVQKGIPLPRSLKNIYKELSTDIPGFNIPAHGNLEQWADQGVLLLNATLTVRAGQPGSHQKRGWEKFTDQVIRRLSDERSGIVFLLWGSYAQSKSALIDQSRHHILSSAHPSPLSARRGFYGSGPFSKTNAILEREGKKPIDWQIH